MKVFLALSVFFLLTFPVFSQIQPEVLVVYYSQSGNTKRMAEEVAKGAKSVSGVEVRLKSIEEVSEKDLLEAAAIIVGSPVYNANVAPAVQEFINSWPFEGRPLKDKIGAAFATGGGISIGEEGVMIDILRSMLIYGMIVIGGEKVESAFGASAITDEGPFKEGDWEEIFRIKANGLGRRVSQLVLRLPQKM
ncbi:NAD(P)H dehydrogenase (quinone) [Algoriphagus aquaeductus]|uniref:NAD(P)H dehydrogenase (Quinone) n=1 Tax=Algoriphagus aquaeductus TaxID=475299 RepID=A0A326RJL2_9BACT|nr:flavodoxin family protein [Algoriphagus aquaeductus]PZV77621.1 NAD(P)H dehydrogenase (quinone) [Algoriphagus aquaeductus]